ncbi:MAG: damage-inducible protein DinB [Alphaproteobacteria bacterium]|nr:damage-inducible protein DinB [Alphaproteobacteria bacterium]
MAKVLADHFSQMARYNAWANARLLAACARLTPTEFAAQRVSFFPSLVETLNHVLVVDRYYIADLEGSGRVLVTDETPYRDVAALAEAQAESDRKLIAFCDRLDDSALQRTITIDRRDGVINVETIGATLSHLFMHQIHHRGQAHAMLAGTHVAPPQLDEFFLAGDLPRREAELKSLGIV